MRVICAFNGKGLRQFKEATNEATPTPTLPPPRGREVVFQQPVKRHFQKFLIASAGTQKSHLSLAQSKAGKDPKSPFRLPPKSCAPAANVIE